MKQIITNKNGTTFERKCKDKVYDTKEWCRFKTENSNKLKEIAKEKGITKSVLMRNILEEYIYNYEQTR